MRDRGASLYRVGGIHLGETHGLRADPVVEESKTGTQEPSARLGGSCAPNDHHAGVDRRCYALSVAHGGPKAAREPGLAGQNHVEEHPLIGVVKTSELRAGGKVYEREE